MSTDKESSPAGAEKRETMEKRKVKYRVEINYLSRDYDTRALEISSPAYTLEDAFRKYFAACAEKCADDPEKPARVHLWEYHYTRDPETYSGWRLAPKTLAKNF